MNFRSCFTSALTSMALAIGSFSANAAVTVGVNDDGNCYPFSCFASDSGIRYQQVYSSSAFSGTTSVGSVSFFLWSGGLMDSASYSVSFYNTAAPVGGLSSSPIANLGSLLSSFGTFSVSGSMPAELTLDGVDFLYDPTLGNLLMDVTVLGLTATNSYQSFFQADNTGLQTQRLHSYDGVNGTTGIGALVTRFNDGNDVPEPESLALFGLGLLALMATRRRNSK